MLSSRAPTQSFSKRVDFITHSITVSLQNRVRDTILYKVGVWQRKNQHKHAHAAAGTVQDARRGVVNRARPCTEGAWAREGGAQGAPPMCFDMLIRVDRVFTDGN